MSQVLACGGGGMSYDQRGQLQVGPLLQHAISLTGAEEAKVCVAGLMALWRVHGLPEVLAEAYETGVVLAGVSAGALCWASGGTTDSYGPRLQPWTGGLRLVEGSVCPHYDSEGERRPLYRRLVDNGTLEPGWGADDGVGLHYVDGVFAGAVADRADAYAWRVEPGHEQRVAPVRL